jgi:hypothetical protein
VRTQLHWLAGWGLARRVERGWLAVDERLHDAAKARGVAGEGHRQRLRHHEQRLTYQKRFTQDAAGR